MAKAKPKKKKKKKDKVSKPVPVAWEDLEKSPLLYSNIQMVQHSFDEFIISFGHVQPPIIEAKTKKKEMESIKSVPARVAVRIVISPARMKSLIDILEENYQGYMEHMESEIKRRGL